MRVFIVDLDGSIDRAALGAALGPGDSLTVIDARDLAPQLRIVASTRAMTALRGRLDAAIRPRRPADAFDVVFFGSGDFHHICVAFVERCAGPLTVLHIDNHPDWVTFPDTLNCGSWVNHALRLPQVVQLVTLGPSGSDLDWPELKAGNLRAVQSGRLRVVPWRPIRSRVLRHYGDAHCWRQHKGVLHWEHADSAAALARALDDIRTRAVYLTIDKDALSGAEAATNWDQGQMSVADIETVVQRLASERRLVGVDVCGDFSPPRFSDPLRWLLATLDHPRRNAPDAARALNAATNARLLAVFRTASHAAAGRS